MEMQLAAVLATLALGGALVVLFFGKWWQPLADGDKRASRSSTTPSRPCCSCGPTCSAAGRRAGAGAAARVVVARAGRTGRGGVHQDPGVGRGAAGGRHCSSSPRSWSSCPRRGPPDRPARPWRPASDGRRRRTGREAGAGRQPGRRHGDGVCQVGEGRRRGEAEHGQAHFDPPTPATCSLRRGDVGRGRRRQAREASELHPAARALPLRSGRTSYVR